MYALDYSPIPEKKFQLESKFPDPLNFETYFDFEEALLLWRKDVIKSLQIAAPKEALSARKEMLLPSIVGSMLYRPRFEQHDDETEFSEKMDVSCSSTMAGNALLRETLEDDVDDIEEFEDNNDGEMVVGDPWDVQLYPAEPDPSLYSTFEEYEVAMKNWAYVCSQTVVLPPHPLQITDILNLTVAEERKRKEQEEENVILLSANSKNQQLPTKEGVIRNGLIVVHTTSDPLYTNFPPTKRKFSPKRRIGAARQRAPSLNVETLQVSTQGIAQIQRLFHQMVEKRRRLKESAMNLYRQQIHPRLHGTFLRPFDAKITYGDAVTGISTQNALLPDDTVERSVFLDCPQEINGKKIEPNHFMYDLQSIDLKKLTNADSPEYILKLKTELRNLESNQRLDHLTSWFNPTIPASIHKKAGDQIHQMITAPPGNALSLNENQIIEILSNDMQLDGFVSLMSKISDNAESLLRDEGGEESATNVQLVLSCMQPSYFPRILSLFSDSPSSLVHAKLAFLVSQAAQSQHATSILQKFVDTHDLTSLYRMAYAITFFEEVPVDLFPYHPSTIALVRQLVGEQVFKIVETLLFHYYFKVISSTTLRHSFEFIAINRFVASTKTKMAKSLGSLLSANPSVLGTHFFKFLGMRSSTVSSFFLFLIVQLFHNNDCPTIKELLKSDAADVINNLRNLCSSKFLHVKWATRRLFTILQEKEWVDFLFEKYPISPLFEKDLLSQKSIGVPSDLSIICHEISMNALNSVQTTIGNADNDLSKYEFLLTIAEGSLFRKLMAHVMSLRFEDASFESTEQLCSLLAQISKTISHLSYNTPEGKGQTSYSLQAFPTGTSCSAPSRLSINATSSL
eukprot:TRINITY_DN222_c2_g1_i1.p1 TRINITY_DN222_c2_g1~~TRINITY_DN222_c2_g1_i1.p1  ORF type:complete len:915 (-),score=268.97 TRINITY_DN222_c2_g1_i1:341-2899(-)